MPRYEYEYCSEGKRHRVERTFRMDDAPPSIQLQVGDEIFIAHRVISLTARMSINWDAYEPSDLPAPDASL